MKKDIFLKLKKKFVLSCVLIGGIILLAVMVGIFAFVYTDNAKQVTNSLNLTLRSDRLSNPNCSKIVEIDGRLYFQGAQYDQDDIEDIAEKAFESKTAKLRERTLFHRSRKPIGRLRLTTLQLIVGLVALCLIALMGLFMRKKAIHPSKSLTTGRNTMQTPAKLTPLTFPTLCRNKQSRPLLPTTKMVDNIDCYISVWTLSICLPWKNSQSRTQKSTFLR